jgi:asparagine synthase (glutamine-hydrolysing)
MVQTDFLDELGRCVPRLEEPCGIPSAPALLQLSRFASASVKVVLAGQGADEPHGGYGYHRAAAMLHHVRRLPAFLSGPLAVAADAIPRAARAKRLAHLVGRMPDGERLMRLIEITTHRQRAELTGRRGEEAEGERLETAGQVLADVGDRDLLDQALYFDSRWRLPDAILLCNDKMSMAASLELRVPFLDLELMRFVERVPARLRAGARRGKRLHRLAMERLLPKEIVDRPKHGFATPYDRWLRESLGQEVERRYAPGSELEQWIAPDAARRLVAEHRSGRADHKSVLYCLLELSEWHRAFVAAPELVGA